MNHQIRIYPITPNLIGDLGRLKTVKLDCKPILGDRRNSVVVTISEELLQDFRTGARLSRLRISEYISTLVNKNYEKESAYQAKCQEMFGGKREITVPGIGRIDLLTSDMVIEVKCKYLWKAALGQVLAYAVNYPGYKRAIALTPDDSPYKKEVIEEVCSKYQVSVIWL